MTLCNHCRQFVKMALVNDLYFTIYLPAMKHSDEWTISKVRLNQCLHKDSLLFD